MWSGKTTKVFGSESSPQEPNKHEHEQGTNSGKKYLDLSPKDAEEVEKTHNETKINYGSKLTNDDDETCGCNCTIM